MRSQEIIIDTDPGVDDALAIAFGIKAKLPIQAIATVYGNSTIENSTSNALTILELSHSDIPVFQGASSPLVGENKFAHSHGDNGLGGFTLQTEMVAQEQSATQHYEEVIRTLEGDVTIVAIGPTTNLGELIDNDPQLFSKVGKVIIMGGVFGEAGNVSPYAEFNVYNDPHSLQKILNSGHSNITIVPANICRQVTFKQEVFDQITNPSLADSLAKISEMYISYYTKDTDYGGFDGGVMYDLLAIALLVDPSLFEGEKVKVRVETADQEKYGLTEIVDGTPNCTVITSVDAQKVKELYISVMNR